MTEMNSDTSLGLLFLFSFALGLKHAVEPDHLAAISTVVTDRNTLWSASLVGGLWGIGHTVALLASPGLVQSRSRGEEERNP